MAYTNTTSAVVNNTGSDGRKDTDAPCIRASYRPEVITLDNTEVFYFREGAVYTDEITRVMQVTASTGAKSGTSLTQTALVYFYKAISWVEVVGAAAEAAPLIFNSTNEASVDTGDVSIGYDSSTLNYFIRNDAGADAVFSMVRIDGASDIPNI